MTIVENPNLGLRFVLTPNGPVLTQGCTTDPPHRDRIEPEWATHGTHDTTMHFDMKADS
jgi:hypothetical protein